MVGIILGDIAGSIYEFKNYKGLDVDALPLFTEEKFYTDDSILALATMNALRVYKNDLNRLGSYYIDQLHYYYSQYPNLSWGDNFARWSSRKLRIPYNSKGNGAGVRAIPVAFYADDEKHLKKLTYIITATTHNHPLALKYTEAIVLATYLAKTTKDKVLIKRRIEEEYFPLDLSVAELRKTYKYSELIENCVPQALTCFLEASTFNDALRNAISIGGDTDTICAMVGGLAEAFYGITPREVALAVSYFQEHDYKNLLPLDNYYSSGTTSTSI
jgi:ADP-ribosylglycohydrolase